VDPDLTSDQQLLRETTARFIEERCPLTMVRALAEDRADIGPTYLRETAILGWFSLLVPERHGGGSVSGRGVLDAAVLAEERGRFLQPGPFVPGNVVAATLASHGSDNHRAEVLPKLLSGRRTAAWALAGPLGDWTPESGVHAATVPSGWALRGSKGLVQDAHLAEWVLVSASSGIGVSQFLVPARAPGVTIRPMESLDVSRRLCEVRFDGVRVSPSDVVGEVDNAVHMIERQIQLAAVLTVAESVGAMDETLRFTVQYAKTRTAFGRQIGSFQGVKHLLANTALLLEQSKSISVAASHAVQDETRDADEIASMAKSFVGEAGIELSQNCWQVFAGIGYTWEHDLHLYLRRLTTDSTLYGEPAWHRERICAIHRL